MNYDFDTVIPRIGSDSLKWEKYTGEDIIPLWVADMDFATAPEIQQALVERLQHPVYGYTVPSVKLKDTIQRYLHAQFGWEIEPAWLCFLPGVVAGLSASCRAWLRPGAEALIHTPIYHHFFQVHDPSQHTLLEVPLVRQHDRWTYDLPAMEAAISDKTRLILLCSPHNPVGTVFSRQELIEVCELAARHQAVVVSDEIHNGLVLNPDTPHIPTAMAASFHADNIVTLMSQSKTFNLAGMNLSFAVVQNESLREQFSAACAEVMAGPGVMSYVSAQVAFEQGEPWRQALLDYLRGNLALIHEVLDPLPGLSVGRCDATYLAWIDATGLKLNDTAAFFEEHGVGLSPGEQFGTSGYLRLNFACPRETLQKGLDRMVSAVRAVSS